MAQGLGDADLDAAVDRYRQHAPREYRDLLDSARDESHESAA